MTRYMPRRDPNAHWSDRLANEAGKRWSRQHRLWWGWLLLRRRWQGEAASAGLSPGEGRRPGLSEPLLDSDESAQVRAEWIRHDAQARRRALAELVRKKQREGWPHQGSEPDEPEKPPRQRASLQLLQALAWAIRRLVPAARDEMVDNWLAAPSMPRVFIRAKWIEPPSEEMEFGFHITYLELWEMELWRQEPEGRLSLMSTRTMNDSEAQAMWRQRRAAGWRLVPPHG